MHDSRPASYEDLAAEYYDPVRHPTCANFRQASRLLLEKWLPKYLPGGSAVCEVGPGRSLVAELADQTGKAFCTMTLLDSSSAMLAYSKEFEKNGTELLVGKASSMPAESNSLNGVIACLGDPYNDSEFWQEVFRTLIPGGVCLYTTPSFEWASGFRKSGDPSDRMHAEFLLRDGRRVLVPSMIYSDQDQAEMIQAAGLNVVVIEHVRVNQLSGPLSPKLLMNGERHGIAVAGFVAGKPQ